MTTQTKKILIVYQTHGNEPIGKDVSLLFQKNFLELSSNCDFIIGNPEAAKLNVRFIDCDINRIAPGNSASELYEMRRAAELAIIMSSYTYVIDIHETKSGDDIMLIVPSYSKTQLKTAQFCPSNNNHW